MRRITSWIAGTLLATLSAAAFATPPGISSQLEGQIIVSVYDFARIGPKTVAQSEQLATRIFALARVDARWTTESLPEAKNIMMDFSPTGPGGCTAPLPAVLQVQVLSHAPNGFPPQALGFSLPCAERGMQVTLFEDRVETVSRSSHASFYRVLAHALTHELGHVLLRSDLHEKSGLMKAIWTESDWQRAAVTIIPFSLDDMRFIAGQLSVIKTRDSAERPIPIPGATGGLAREGPMLPVGAAGLSETVRFCKSGDNDSRTDRDCLQ